MAHFSLLILLLLHLLHLTSAVFDITTFGASSDGQTDSAQPFLRAWEAACGSSGPSTIYVPTGTFLLGQATFAGPCKSSRITVQIDGTLVSPSNYNGFGRSGDWIVFDNVEGVSVYGGTIDGRGASLWPCKANGHNCPDGATSLTFLNSNDIMISGLTSIDSELYHIVIDSCQGATVQGLKISAPGNSPNTDGIHVQMSTGVTVTGASIKTGDDCISIGPGTTNLWIEQVTCGPGHGISIGSLGKENQEEGVQNVTVKTTVFTGTENGLRIKTWGRPSDGFVRGVVFEHSIMQNVENPIIIDQNYCPDDDGCPEKVKEYIRCIIDSFDVLMTGSDDPDPSMADDDSPAPIARIHYRRRGLNRQPPAMSQASKDHLRSTPLPPSRGPSRAAASTVESHLPRDSTTPPRFPRSHGFASVARKTPSHATRRSGGFEISEGSFGLLGSLPDSVRSADDVGLPVDVLKPAHFPSNLNGAGAEAQTHSQHFVSAALPSEKFPTTEMEISMVDAPSTSLAVGIGGKLGKKKKGKSSRPYSPPKVIDSNSSSPIVVSSSSPIHNDALPPPSNDQATILDPPHPSKSDDTLIVDLVERDKAMKLQKLKPVAELKDPSLDITKESIVHVANSCGFVFDGDPDVTIARLENLLAQRR